MADNFLNCFNMIWDIRKEYGGERTEKVNVSKVSEQELESNSSVINIRKNVNETRLFAYRPLKENEVQESMKDIGQRKSAGRDKCHQRYSMLEQEPLHHL